ncbi:tRNA (guanine(26)-N(2))-dimethyltransferase isoform X2 [Daucus carota subsp. sativus]|uniref:tRNA (guanine(26)-N(2))-dimethyltransferase isoform X2 n=1 Tax=Daucus carota subsp. sativus TaxID=79200 RepID=UPI0007EF7860|nr:PREDICTED: tRNA (guanine(26)-N(2))-dimethyltransferase isoform X2 [Daucus carota subsp. sativus]
MILLSPKPTCILFNKPINPFSKSNHPKPHHQNNTTPSSNHHISCKSEYKTERGLQFDVGDTFFRHESATGRDLAVLAAAIHKKANNDKLRVLDAMCGCGIRSLRYLVEADADFVLANDADDFHRSVVLSNLSAKVPRISEDGRGRRWLVTNDDANRVMMECCLRRDYFDFIDIDSFGSDSSFLRSAFEALRFGGLVYVTSTDGYTSGGHRPLHSLSSYGAYICPMPYCNELGLRMLIGGAIREAAVLGYYVTPLFSYYSYHGPVFRVLLRVNRGKLPISRYCSECGNSEAISWDKLGQLNCPCNSNVPGSLVVSGPLWTGPLHSKSYLEEMLNLAEEWGWIGNNIGVDLEKLLKYMIDESDPQLPFGYIKLDEVSSRGKINSPPLRSMLSSLQKNGYTASRSHIESNAIKTNCPMSMCIMIAKELQAC